MAKRKREILPNQHNQTPDQPENSHKFTAWAMIRERSAYRIVELEIEGSQIVQVSSTEPNLQTIQLQKISDAMVKQAHHGW